MTATGTPFSPILATGAVAGVHPQTGRQRVLGSAFAMRRGDVFCTAGHVLPVEGAPTPHIVVATPRQKVVHEVVAWKAHEWADLGLLFTGAKHYFPVTPMLGMHAPDIPEERRALMCFTDNVTLDDVSLGGDVASYGYPIELPFFEDDGVEASPSVIRTYIQRFVRQQSGRKKYLAAQLDAPFAQGLSGAPIFLPGDQQRVFAVVTGTAQAQQHLHQVSDTTVDGIRTIEKTYRVWPQGIALVLDDFRSWLDDAIEERVGPEPSTQFSGPVGTP